MSQIPLSWGTVLCHWVIDSSGFKTILPRNFRNQLPSDAVSHVGRMESPATPPHMVYLTFCVCSLSKVTLKISPMYIYYGKKYRTVYTDGRHTDYGRLICIWYQSDTIIFVMYKYVPTTCFGPF